MSYMNNTKLNLRMSAYCLIYFFPQNQTLDCSNTS